jgi:hypothetical protein
VSATEKFSKLYGLPFGALFSEKLELSSSIL